MQYFRFWCYKVLPLVYDDSLSYYEVLCKVVKYINELIDQDKIFAEHIDGLQSDMSMVKEWIDNFDTSYAEKIIKDYLATMIFVDISESGYIIYHIPENWESINFKTTGLDISIPGTEYGRLVLSI